MRRKLGAPLLSLLLLWLGLILGGRNAAGRADEPVWDTYLYLPLIVRPVEPPTTVYVLPLTRFYQIRAEGPITRALQLGGAVNFWEWDYPRHYANVAVAQPTGGLVASVERTLLVFAAPEPLPTGQLVRAAVRGVGFSYPPDGWPNVPVYAAAATTTRPTTPAAAFQAGEAWEEAWNFPVGASTGLWCAQELYPVALPATLPATLPAEVGIILRSGIEDRPELWPGLFYYSALFNWTEGLCGADSSAAPELWLWVAE